MSFERDSEDAQPQTVHRKSVIARMLEGAALIAFLSLFTMFNRSARSEFAVSTRVIMFLLASLAGAVGGVAYYASDTWRARGGIFKTVANVSSILAYVAAVLVFLGLWMVLGVGPEP